MFDSIRIGGGKPQVLIVAQFQDDQTSKQLRDLDPYGHIAAARQRGEASGEPGRIFELFSGAASSAAKGAARGRAKPAASTPAGRIMIVGVGPQEKFMVGSLRTIAASIGRRLALTRETDIMVDFTEVLSAAKADAFQAGSAFAEGLGLLAWTFDTFKGKATKAPKRTRLNVRAAQDEFEQGMERGLALAESTNFARSLSETPPNVCTPDWIADQAQRMARKAGLKITVFRGRDLERENFAGLINVGKASENAPCMIRLEYTPSGAAGRGKKTGRARGRSVKPVVLIGKTMTYDSGGLSLKVGGSMVGMKRDKDGGCAVLGAMHAIATTVRPRVPVVAFLACAENSISDEAYRPDDIIRFRNDVTVEVTNTDAEGRLVLADAYAYACEVENPRYIVELSTLTGGVVTALGSTFAGLWCDDDNLRARLEAASEASGERIWRLPLHQEYRDMMKSPVADILNSNPNRKAHPIQGAAFLSYFVADGIPWAHIDIAGVHAVEGDSGPFIKGPTGWGTRLLASLLESE
jgi:leucyl aminopeptidase